MTDRLMALVIAAVAVGLVAMVLALQMARFRECRAHGFSTFYCLGQL